MGVIRFRVEITGEAPSAPTKYSDGVASAVTQADAQNATDDFVAALKAAGFTVGGTINSHDTAVDNSAASSTFGEFGDEVTI